MSASSTMNDGAQVEWLDREHQERVDRVGRCERAKDREREAKTEAAILTEEMERLNGNRNSLGSDEHVDAIRESAWFPYTEDLAKGARLAWLLDSVFWFVLWGGLWWLWVRYYEDAGQAVPSWLYFAGIPAALGLAVICARTSKRFGHKYAVTRLTDTHSVDNTIDRLVRFAGRCTVAAGVLLASVMALLFFSPPRWASATTLLGGLIGFSANIVLGLAAGVGGQAADILRKVAVRDHIDSLLRMKERTRRHLSRFFTALVITMSALSSLPTLAAPDGVWVMAIDSTDSMDPVQRQTGIDAFIEGAFDRAHGLGVRAIQIVKFSNDVLLADMTLVPVPELPPQEDCRNAKPEAAFGKSIILISPTAAAARRQDAIEACELRGAAARRTAASEQQCFREQLRRATRVRPRDDVSTLIVPLIQKLMLRPYVRVIDVLTDGIDNSGFPPSGLRVPPHLPVTIILTRPNPKRRAPTLKDVLAGADRWAEVKGFFVTSVGEYAAVMQSRGAR